LLAEFIGFRLVAESRGNCGLFGEKRNVAINTILPGMFRTDSMQLRFDAQAKQNGTTPEQEVDKWIAQVGIPASKLGDTRDVGALCALLCSEFASFIIGQSIVIDGGQHFSTF